MKKRILAFLLAVSIAVSMLVLPASAAGNANTAVQLSITLNAIDSSQQAALNAVVTRGALARMLVSYSTYRESVGSQGTVGTLFTDLPGTSPYAPYVRIAVQNGWMNGYTDGSFRPDNAVTLEEAVTAILKLMGYKMTDLSGSFPNAQLNKASELGLRNQVDRSQGEVLNYEECALLFYNALTAQHRQRQCLRQQPGLHGLQRPGGYLQRHAQEPEGPLCGGRYGPAALCSQDGLPQR